MSGSETDALAALDHALVLAPYRRDADYLGRLLAEHDIRCIVCSGAGDLVDGLASSPGVVVATHEALNPSALAAIANHLTLQPSWSEIPIVILLDRSSPNARVRTELQQAWPRARQIFYQRPVTPLELISGVQSALLVRLRQRDVRDHIAREIELRRELNHRVKNILASVGSIFEMTRRGATSIEELTEDYRGRLGALANVHSAVFQADGEVVSIADIVDLTFAPYKLRDGERIVADGPAIMLDREAATTLALCLHELTTNAIKYGALSVAEGHVRFEWSLGVEQRDEVSIRWQERDGPPAHEPARPGYGTRYLRSALTGMFGRKPLIAFEPEGLICEVRGPLSRITGKSRGEM